MAAPTTCANCGEAVDEEVDDRCPSCNAPLKVVCANCGDYAPEGEEYCPSCGSSLADATQGI